MKRSYNEKLYAKRGYRMNIQDQMKLMDSVFKTLDETGYLFEEKQKREDERAKENQHRKEEGLSCI